MAGGFAEGLSSGLHTFQQLAMRRLLQKQEEQGRENRRQQRFQEVTQLYVSAGMSEEEAALKGQATVLGVQLPKPPYDPAPVQDLLRSFGVPEDSPFMKAGLNPNLYPTQQLIADASNFYRKDASNLSDESYKRMYEVGSWEGSGIESWEDLKLAGEFAQLYGQKATGQVFNFGGDADQPEFVRKGEEGVKLLEDKESYEDISVPEKAYLDARGFTDTDLRSWYNVVKESKLKISVSNTLNDVLQTEKDRRDDIFMRPGELGFGEVDTFPGAVLAWQQGTLEEGPKKKELDENYDKKTGRLKEGVLIKAFEKRVRFMEELNTRLNLSEPETEKVAEWVTKLKETSKQETRGQTRQYLEEFADELGLDKKLIDLILDELYDE